MDIPKSFSCHPTNVRSQAMDAEGRTPSILASSGQNSEDCAESVEDRISEERIYDQVVDEHFIASKLYVSAS